MTLATEQSGNVQCLEYTGHWTSLGAGYLNDIAVFSPMEEEGIVVCNLCPKSFSNNRQLNNHSRTHLPFNIPRMCRTCKTEFFTNGLHPNRIYCSRKCLFKWHDVQPNRMFKKKIAANKAGHAERLRKLRIAEWSNAGYHPGFDVEDCKSLPALVDDVLLGSIFGDGHIQFKYKRQIRYHEAHCPKQSDYLKWKSEIFQKHFTCRPLYVDSKSNHRLCFSSIDLYPYRQLFYENNKKKITSTTLSRLNLTSLLIWYLDDGSLCRKVGKYKTSIEIRINNYQIARTDVPYLKNRLEEITGVPTVIRDVKGTNMIGIMIAFNNLNSRRLLEKLNFLGKSLGIPDCMNYKLGVT